MQSGVTEIVIKDKIRPDNTSIRIYEVQNSMPNNKIKQESKDTVQKFVFVFCNIIFSYDVLGRKTKVYF